MVLRVQLCASSTKRRPRAGVIKHGLCVFASDRSESRHPENKPATRPWLRNARHFRTNNRKCSSFSSYKDHLVKQLLLNINSHYHQFHQSSWSLTPYLLSNTKNCEPGTIAHLGYSEIVIVGHL